MISIFSIRQPISLFPVDPLGLFSSRKRSIGWWLILALLLCWIPVLFINTPALADTDRPSAAGAEIFEFHCSACHPRGGNIIRRGKTLKPRALQRNGYNSIAAIADLVTRGKNNMSAYAGKLSADQITEVSAYVLAQAERGWR